MIDAWKSQLRKGAAELAVLALLEQREAYGLEILQALTRGDQLGVSEGSIYPLLKRLEAKGVLHRRRSETDERARVISLTPTGRALQQRARWRS